METIPFEEQITGDANDVRLVLRPGIVKSSNAIRSMHAIGIELTDG